jgi:cell volume regulation protein A
MADIMLSVTYFGILLGLGIIVANLLKKVSIPDTLFLLLLGLVMGPTLYTNPAITQYVSTTLVDVNMMGNVPDFLRSLALIMVVFTGTFNLGLRTFKRVGHMAVNLALAGVIFNTVVMGLVANVLFGFDIIYSFLMAAVVSGTCTSVVFAFEGSLKKARKAMNVIKVESIINSPLSVLLPIIFLDLVAIEPGAIIEPMLYLSQFWVMVAVGVGAGLIVDLGISIILKGMLKQYTPLMLFAVALVTYALAENVGGSGMLAVAVCGLMAGNKIRQDDTDVQKFDDHLSEMLRISVFTLLGAQVTLFIGIEEFLMIFAFFLVMFLIRPVFLFGVLGKKKKDFTRKEFLLMGFVTPRGLGAAAMAPIVASALVAAGSPEIATRVINTIFLVIIFSVLFSTVTALMAGRSMKNEKPEKKETPPKAEDSCEYEEIENTEDPHLESEKPPPTKVYV